MTLSEELLGGQVESVWPHNPRRARPTLINGRPWGHGAIQVGTAPADWLCDDCGRRPRARAAARHIYRDGTQRCTPCARIWCDRRWPPAGGQLPVSPPSTHVAEPEPGPLPATSCFGQQALPLGPS